MCFKVLTFIEKLSCNIFQNFFFYLLGKVKIYRVKRVSRKSKKWIAASENKICDAPGSWYCVGQYPPALDKLMAKKEAFTQLEDFNAKKGKRNLFLLYFTIINYYV